MPKAATFYHYGISPWEIEVIYDTLGRSYEVEEKQTQPDDPLYVSMIDISFPEPFGEPFFAEFTMDSWHKIKGVVKDVKERRGRKGLKTLIKFAGWGNQKAELVFPLMSKDDRQFGMGIEKLEYIADIVPVQLNSVPQNTDEVFYSYDEATFRWSPGTAKAGGVNYFFKNGEWKK